MHKITLSDYIKTIRKYSKNTRKSYQDILSILFGIICSIDESYHVYDASSSRIINREYDVPFDVREKYNNKSKNDKRNDSNIFINRMVDSSSIDALIKEVKKQILFSDISYTDKKSIENTKDSYDILSFYLNIAIINDNRIHINETLYKNNNGIIKLINGDLIAMSFNKKLTQEDKIVVIPVDSNFNMKLKDSKGNDIISKDAIHGKWIIKINSFNIKRPKIEYINNHDFKIGIYSVNKTKFYLLPISELKSRNKAESSIKTIQKALNALACEYNISGNGTPLYIPLIGTGRSRLKLDLKESIELIKNNFINNENGFYGEVNIVIYNKNVEELEDL